MIEKRKTKTKRKLLQELDTLRSRISQLEQVEHKIIDEGLEELGLRFERIFDYLTEGVLFTDLEKKRLVYGNKAICQMLGYDVKEIPILEIKRIYPPDYSAQLLKQFEKQASGEFVYRKDIPITRKDGSLLYFDVISVPLTFSNKIYIISFLSESSSLKSRWKLKNIESHLSQPLTKTEMRILKSIIQGMSNKEIAHLLHRSIRTIQNHRLHIMKKLRVDNSTELVRRAIIMGQVNLDEIPRQNENKQENHLGE